jgi:hypothetical protein
VIAEGGSTISEGDRSISVLLHLDSITTSDAPAKTQHFLVLTAKDDADSGEIDYINIYKDINICISLSIVKTQKIL